MIYDAGQVNNHLVELSVRPPCKEAIELLCDANAQKQNTMNVHPRYYLPSQVGGGRDPRSWALSGDPS